MAASFSPLHFQLAALENLELLSGRPFFLEAPQQGRELKPNVRRLRVQSLGLFEVAAGFFQPLLARQDEPQLVLRVRVLIVEFDRAAQLAFGLVETAQLAQRQAAHVRRVELGKVRRLLGDIGIHLGECLSVVVRADKHLGESQPSRRIFPVELSEPREAQGPPHRSGPGGRTAYPG